MHWLIVADAGRARFLAGNELLDELTEVEDLIHPAARLRATDVYTDHSGRRGVGSLDPHTAKKEANAQTFAREVAACATRHIEDYERLIVVAPPQFLGKLKGTLSARVAAKVVATVAKDFTSLPLRDVPAAVKRCLPSTVGMG